MLAGPDLTTDDGIGNHLLNILSNSALEGPSTQLWIKALLSHEVTSRNGLLHQDIDIL